MPIETLQSYAPLVGTVGVILWLIYERMTSGSDKLKKDINSDNAQRIAQLDKRLTESETARKDESLLHAEEIAKMKITLSEMMGREKANEAHIVMLKALLQDKNPEVLAILKEIKSLNKELIGFIKAMYSENKEILNYQTNILEKGATRSGKIDKASEEEDGHVLRLPDKK